MYISTDAKEFDLSNLQAISPKYAAAMIACAGERKLYEVRLFYIKDYKCNIEI